MNTYIYICKIKTVGYAFAVETKELAEKWVTQNPESHYYEEIAILRDF